MSAIVSHFTHSWTLPIILGSLTTILVLIWVFWNKIITKIGNISSHKFSDNLSQEQTKSTAIKINGGSDINLDNITGINVNSVVDAKKVKRFRARNIFHIITRKGNRKDNNKQTGTT